MRKIQGVLLKGFLPVFLMCYGMAFSAKADTFSTTTLVYYVDNPTDTNASSYNPWGLTNTGGVKVSGSPALAITSAGDLENVSFSTSATQGVAVGTISGTDFTIELFNPPSSAPGPIVTGTTLNPGTYVFNSCMDYFGAKTAAGTTGYSYGCGSPAPVVACMTGQDCNSGTVPYDQVTINVAQNGVVTVASDSLEVAFAPTPELPSLALFGTGLLAIGFVLRKKRFVL